MPEKGSHLHRSMLAKAAASYAGFNFRKAWRTVTQLFDDALQPSGLRSTQFVLLVMAYLHGPVSVARLAREPVTERSTLTRNLQPLTKRRLIQLSEGKDRRTKMAALPPQGRGNPSRGDPLLAEGLEPDRDLIGPKTMVKPSLRPHEDRDSDAG